MTIASIKLTSTVRRTVVLLVLTAAACASDDEPTTTPTEAVDAADSAPTSSPATASTPTQPAPAETDPAQSAAETTDQAISSSASPTIEAANLSVAFEEYLRAHVEASGLIGSVLVANGDDVIFEAGYGLADIDAGTTNSPATIHRIGSVTKGFTAAMILSLDDSGALRVSDPIALYLPDFPRGDEITVQQLLTHSAGVFNYTDDPLFVDQAAIEISIDALISTFADRPLDFDPGTSWSYSNSGYVLLTKIIEVASRMTYADYFQEAIASPLGLAATAVESVTEVPPERSAGYVPAPRGFEPAAAIHPSVPAGAGNITSTVRDLHRWDVALLSGAILSVEAREIMFSNEVRPDPTSDEDAYGAGWFLGERFDRQVIEHGGGIFGYSAMNTMYPGDQLIVVVLSNNEAAPSAEIAEGLAAIAFGEAYEVPVALQVDAEVLATYAGDYELDLGGGAAPLPIAITIEGASLIAQAAGQGPLQGAARTDRRFSFLGGTIVIEFEPGADGTVDSFTLEQSGQTFRATRMSG